jgi:hypothetical protein
MLILLLNFSYSVTMEKMGTLFILIMSFQAITASNDLTFLTEDRMVKVSTVLENDRISVVVPTTYSLAQIKKSK